MSDVEETRNDNFFAFFVFLFLAICICYCSRNEEQANDPADDPIAGWIPNPSAATENLEQRRQEIEDHLILKQVVIAPEQEQQQQPEPEEQEEPTISASTSSATRKVERPMMERLVKSERTFSSYASAVKRMTSSSSQRKKVVSFAALDNRSQSLPVGFLKGDEENQDKKEETTCNAPAPAAAPEDHQGGGHDHNHSHNTSSPPPPASADAAPTKTSKTSIKHRRKSDIIARTLARTLSASQDYLAPTTCDICLLDYEVGEQVAWSNNEGCIHAFHKECITDWLLRKPHCPLCRRDYIVLEEAAREA